MKLRVMSWDIEVLPLGEQMPVADKCPITMMSLCGNYDIANGKKKVVMILDRNGKDSREDRGEYILARFADERRIIEVWENIVKRTDVIVGYNVNGFDFPYVIDRARVLNININVGMADDRLWHKGRISKGMKVVTIGGMKGRIIFDVLYMLRRGDESNVFKKEYNLKNLTLEWVSGEILGEEKGKLKFGARDMVIWWNTGSREEEFISYGLRDAEVVLEMVQKFRLLDRFIMLSRKSGKLVQDVVDSTGFGGLVENLLMKKFREENRVVPCRSKGGFGDISSDVDDIEGAYVMEPKLGITDHLGSVDYKSLYPSLMIRHNMCFTTVVGSELEYLMKKGLQVDIIKGDGEEGIEYGIFVKSSVKKGIIPVILEDLMVERQRLKGLMKKSEKGSAKYIMYDAGQNAAKILLNSFFGYTGDSTSKMYSWSVASSVTGAGRKQIMKTIDDINSSAVKMGENEYRMRVALGDTDSSYIQVIGGIEEVLNRNIVVGCVSQVIEKVNLGLEKPMELAFENYIRRLLVTAKKHYTMLVEDEKGHRGIVNKGIESVRRDWCDFSSENMDNVIEILLGNDDVGSGIKNSIQFVKDECNRLIDGNVILDKLILSKKLSKPLTSYDAKAVHCMVAKKMNARGKSVEIGDRVSYIITNNGKKLISEKAEEVELVREGKFKVDYDYYIQHQLLPPVMRVFEVIGVKDKSILQDRRQKSLLDY